jgi:hypothetical protein
MAKPTLASEVGFEPEKLDQTVDRLIRQLDAGLNDVAQLQPLITRLAARLAVDLDERDDGGTPDERERNHEKLLAKLERYTKLLLNLTKTTDELARLRSFAAGGADQRPDVGRLSDYELEELVLKAAQGLNAERSNNGDDSAL